MDIKTQVPLFVNPKLPSQTRVALVDKRQGIIVDKADARWERLVHFQGDDRPTMVKLEHISRGWWPNGSEFKPSWVQGKPLDYAKGGHVVD